MRFPFFVTDAAFVALALVSVLLAFIYPNVTTYAFSIIAAALTVAMIKRSHDALDGFETSLSKIKGLAWKPVFLSAGSVAMTYRGREFTYRSSSGYERDGAIPVEYSLSTPVRTKKTLEVKGTDAPGAPEVSGDKALFAKIRKETLEFDSKYGLSLLRAGDGLLSLSVCLGFSKIPIPKEQKLADMTAFISDYLAFASDVAARLD
ncbi:MAG TPA: hypothetical protein VLD37_05635 [Candidatus Bilamarchaeum sp.]|nr:hypothetical protein [Candidatus Bilamarchaeum sp.]